MAWIQTVSGIPFHPLEPSQDMIEITDIAHALSMICRFNGHTSKFYSVAEHCVRMSEEVPSALAFAALLHDAAEAYISDVVSPIKPLLGDFKGIENRIMAVVETKFGITFEPGDRNGIKTADLRMLATERRQLMTLHAPEWDSLQNIPPYEITLACWGPEEAKARFLLRFRQLSD